MGHVVVVDDFAEALDLVREVLSPMAHEVHTFEDPHAALAHLTLHPVDLLLMDVRMPGMNGRELLQQVKEKVPHHPPKVVLLCGATDEGEAVRTEAPVQVHGLIAKPFSIQMLMKTVEELLGR